MSAPSSTARISRAPDIMAPDRFASVKSEAMATVEVIWAPARLAPVSTA